MKTKTVTIESKRYEDHDDCLEAARLDVVADEGCEDWQAEAAWEDDATCERIVITIEVAS